MKNKKYAELPGVIVTRDDFPSGLRHLCDDFIEWSFVSDGEIERHVSKLSVEQLETLLNRWDKSKNEIENYAIDNRHLVPMPDSIALVQVFLNNMRSIHSEYRLRIAKRSK